MKDNIHNSTYEGQQSLSEMATGTKCVIVKVNGHGGLRHRLMELGFVKGETVTVIKNAPLMDPVEYQVLQAHISLRRSEADKIEVVALDDERYHSSDFNGTIADDIIADVIKEKSNNITVALVGNPNAGKTSFFNHATGLHEKVGNYGGVTVDFKVGTFHHKGYTINLVDLPGTYSITEYSPEERYVREYLTKNNPDLVLNIVDASNLERNFFLTTQLIDMNVRLVMALNMYDEMTAKGDRFDYKALGKMLGLPIVPTTAVKGIGIDDVLETIIDVYEEKKNLNKHIHINYGRDIEDAIVPIKRKIEVNKDIINIYPARYIAINVLENSRSTIEEIKNLPNGDEIVAEADEKRRSLEKAYDEDVMTLITNARYAFIRGALKETYKKGAKKIKNHAYKADDLLTNKWLGFPILILFVWLMFQATFTIGAYPQEWIEAGVAWFGELVGSWMNDGILRDLIVDGIIAGVGGVL
ncbi:MAG: 50S ribosome-binding GTPase, partial [Bacteroidales bacterium]|nr:50S ribosome-binding GTPase [Bacteroidales bacterium]